MMANMRNFRRILQLDVVGKPCRLISSCNTNLQFARSSYNVDYLKNYSKSSIFSPPNYAMLKEVAEKPTFSNIQYRASSNKSDHVRLWVLERIMSAALPVIIPVAFIFENPIFDTVLAVATVMHAHWGLEAVVVDYVRPLVFGKVIPKLAIFALNLLSILTLAGLIVLIFKGPGIVKSIKQFWAITSEKGNKEK